MLTAFGANVVVSDYNLDAAQEVSQEIEKYGGSVVIDCDVTKDEALVRLVDETVKYYENLNILVNNVGGSGAGQEDPTKIEVAQFKSRTLFRFSGF